MADEHEVVVLLGKASDPDHWVVVGCERFGLLAIDVDQSTPDLGGLASTRFAGVQHPVGANAEVLDCPTRHSGNVVGTICGERPFRVLVLCLGLPMLNEKQLHLFHGTRRHPDDRDGPDALICYVACSRCSTAATLAWRAS